MSHSFAELVSPVEIENWLSQFDLEDRETAILLLDQIDYFSYNRIMNDLKQLHQKVLSHLELDHFVGDKNNEILFRNIDFSKIYSAKSGDLISYFYRSANKIRAASFKNVSDILLENHDKSEKVLVLLEDYINTGIQFLYEIYAKQQHELFNQYKKVYFTVLVANDDAILRFEKIKNRDYESVAQDFTSIIGMNDKKSKKKILEQIQKISSDKIEIIFLNREYSLNNERFNQEISSKIIHLLRKYSFPYYRYGKFPSYGHTIFFYNSPNNLPEILWNAKAIKKDGSPWIPLFRRVEDLSIYDIAKFIPIKEQVW
jgi:hypothetical protein